MASLIPRWTLVGHGLEMRPWGTADLYPPPLSSSPAIFGPSARVCVGFCWEEAL
jgi:hypothetical protein